MLQTCTSTSTFLHQRGCVSFFHSLTHTHTHTLSHTHTHSLSHTRSHKHTHTLTHTHTHTHTHTNSFYHSDTFTPTQTSPQNVFMSPLLLRRGRLGRR